MYSNTTSTQKPAEIKKESNYASKKNQDTYSQKSTYSSSQTSNSPAPKTNAFKKSNNPPPAVTSSQGGWKDDTSLSAIQNAIMRVVKMKGVEKTEGVHIKTLIEELSDLGNSEKIKSEVQWLSDQGQLFETTDQNHFQITTF